MTIHDIDLSETSSNADYRTAVRMIVSLLQKQTPLPPPPEPATWSNMQKAPETTWRKVREGWWQPPAGWRNASGVPIAGQVPESEVPKEVVNMPDAPAN